MGYSGPLILGVPWSVPRGLVMAGADLASALEVSLVCAYVDPASVLTEWEPYRTRTAASLDPTSEEEGPYPAREVRTRLVGLLTDHSIPWSFRALHGQVVPALARLADSTGACMLMVGSGRAGWVAKLSRKLEGAVADCLVKIQDRPVVVVPELRAAQNGAILDDWVSSPLHPCFLGPSNNCLPLPLNNLEDAFRPFHGATEIVGVMEVRDFMRYCCILMLACAG